ncbi:MAG: ZPR1 zinc finger domain-containing protein [Nanoarchaeota archaeon]|nr:ZPR1 zinc finger domain-containing protein [Nanoarchaeota archaeon]MBU1029769.1 ZPR1 zinc finger domain-containing protein [Nanoarchaeota archaeon]MBU1850449.1 ZPR1 zinc finger domain-containing protein [Nanoarchaeota archaeon]
MTNDKNQEFEMEELSGETCPFCNQKTLTLREAPRDVPFFGVVHVFSMDCSNCNYHKADVEAAEEREPVKLSIEVDSEEDMKIRVIKSSTATVKIAHVGSIEPGEAANGYITNIEGILNRMKKQVEIIRDESDDRADVKKAKNIIKKITRVMWGQDKIKITLNDPAGNSAIISDKAVKS